MHSRRIIIYAAVGAGLLWHFVGRPVHRRARYVEVMRRAEEDKCCGVGYGRYPRLCVPALEELSRLGEGNDAVAEAARKQSELCTARRESANMKP